MALERKKTLNVFKDARDAWGSYDDFPVGAKGTDPMPYLSRNRVPQPFFLVSEEEFDAAFARIRSAGVRYYADHDRSGPGEINHYYGGRGIYFDTPDGNLFELITRPYGAVPESRGGLDAAQVR